MVAANPPPVPLTPAVTTQVTPNINVYTCTVQQLLAAFGVSSTETFKAFSIDGQNVTLETTGVIGPVVA